MKTDIETGGYCNGFAYPRSAQTDRHATQVVRVYGCACPPRNEDARPQRQLRTGASYCRQQMTDDSLAHMPRWKRWGIYALGALIMTGIAPMAIATALIHATDVFGAWLESIIGAGGMLALFLGACFAAIVACMVYLFRLVFK